MLALTLLLGLQPAVHGATITVGPGCTLIDAINAANADSAVSGCPAGNGADTLELTGDVTLTFFHNTTDGDNGLPSITSEMTIDGNGFAIARDTGAGTPEFRIFHIAATGDLVLRNITISGGDAREGTSTTARGGGIFNRGLLLLDRSEVSGNRVDFASGSFRTTALGGGIFNETGAHLTVTGSSIVDNQLRATFFAGGGGISSRLGATVTLVDTAVSSNTASAFGDPLDSPRAAGGGLVSSGTVTIRGSTFSANTAGGDDSANGGAIAHDGGEKRLTIENSTLSGNLATASNPSAGAISGDFVDLTHVTLVSNTASSPIGMPQYGTLEGTMSLNNTIVALSDPGPPNDCFGTFTDDGGNFGCVNATAITGLDPTLAANGGLTATHSISGSSNALNSGAGCTFLRDQRGVSRVAACDSGAYEYNPCLTDDGFEGLGSGATDDTCFGGPIALSTPQTHLHCDRDWLTFEPDVGKTYEFKTFNLVSGADTVLDVSKGCGATPRGTDDDGGPGAGSRVVVTHDGGAFLDVLVAEADEVYDPGTSQPSTIEGYDVVVTCIGGCDCMPPEGPDLDLADDSLSTAVTYEACSTLTATDWIVEAAGAVVLRAGSAVVFAPDVTIAGELQVEIDPALLPP